MSNFYQNLSLNVLTEIHKDISIVSDIVPLHSHSFYEILFVLRGNIQYLLNQERFQLKKGDIVLIPPGLSHRPIFTNVQKEPYERFALWIHSDFVEQLTAQNPDMDFAFKTCRQKENYLLRTPSATWTALGTAFNNIYSETEQKKMGWDICVMASSASLLTHLCRTFYYLEAVEPITEKDNLADNVCQYIMAHYQERFTLLEVAGHFLVSPSTISHLFQKKMGISFYRFVTQRRLIAAKNQMLSGAPIQSVWECCGFADYTSFYRAFRKEYGLSPREFLKQHRSFRSEKDSIKVLPH